VVLSDVEMVATGSYAAQMGALFFLAVARVSLVFSCHTCALFVHPCASKSPLHGFPIRAQRETNTSEVDIGGHGVAQFHSWPTAAGSAGLGSRMQVLLTG